MSDQNELPFVSPMLIIFLNYNSHLLCELNSLLELYYGELNITLKLTVTKMNLVDFHKWWLISKIFSVALFWITKTLNCQTSEYPIHLWHPLPRLSVSLDMHKINTRVKQTKLFLRDLHNVHVHRLYPEEYQLLICRENNKKWQHEQISFCDLRNAYMFTWSSIEFELYMWHEKLVFWI